MEFIEIRTQPEMEEAFGIIRELIPELDKEVFFKSLNHDLLKNHKIFGLRSSEKLVSVAAIWLLMNGLFEKLLWIYAFVTTKEMRSKGFGKKLLMNLEAYAVRENFNEIRVHAHCERAIAFWENKANFDLFSHVLRKKI